MRQLQVRNWVRPLRQRRARCRVDEGQRASGHQARADPETTAARSRVPRLSPELEEGAGSPDIAYPGRRVAIFVNGGFWHRCPHCSPSLPKSHSEFWHRKFALNTERDARKLSQLDAADWRTVVVWECELRAEPTQTLARCISPLASSSHPE